MVEAKKQRTPNFLLFATDIHAMQAFSELIKYFFSLAGRHIDSHGSSVSYHSTRTYRTV